MGRVTLGVGGILQGGHMKAILLWLLGVPISVIILLMLFGIL